MLSCCTPFVENIQKGFVVWLFCNGFASIQLNRAKKRVNIRGAEDCGGNEQADEDQREQDRRHAEWSVHPAVGEDVPDHTEQPLQGDGDTGKDGGGG